MENTDKNFNKHELYQRSVQNVKKEAEFFRKLYRMKFNKVPQSFREDFCGTGLLSCEWVKSSVMNTAVGLDYDKETIQWGILNNVQNLTSGCDRVELVLQDVLDEYDPNRKFDIICSLNYSHFLLNQRKDLLKYFSNVTRNIDKGLFIIDFYGGSHIYSEHRYKKNETSDFYEFSGKQMNILNNSSECSLNYKIKKNKYAPLFRYKFRIYSIIELREALEEVGFKEFRLFIKEINEDDEDDYSEYEEIDIKGEYFPESERLTGYLISFKG